MNEACQCFQNLVITWRIRKQPTDLKKFTGLEAYSLQFVLGLPGDSVVVAHTTSHILGDIHPVAERPESKEAPNNQELEPNDVQGAIDGDREFDGGQGG